MSDSPQESFAASPLRIIVPPTEFCPFSTELTLPITPLSLPTSSCFTFNDMQELAGQGISVPPTPSSALLSCSQHAVVSNLASPTSSQFLLTPSTPHLGDVVSETTICVSPAAASESVRGESYRAESRNICSCDVSSPTWLSDLGGHMETDRIFRHNLLETTSVDTDTSPASTPVLSPSAVTPSSQVPSPLAYDLSNSLAISPASLPPAPSPPQTMSPRSSSLARLALKPTGTETFPSTLESLQAWRESVTHGIPLSEDPCSPLTEDVHGGPASETLNHPPMPFYQLQSHRLSPCVPHISKTQAFMMRAKMFSGRVKQLVTRQSVNRQRGSMDRGATFRVVTSQDSENGSVILITAPPPPYDIRPMALIPHSQPGPGQARSRTASEYSSVARASVVEVATGPAESGPRRGGRNRNALRRLSIAALSTIKRF